MSSLARSNGSVEAFFAAERDCHLGDAFVVGATAFRQWLVMKLHTAIAREGHISSDRMGNGRCALLRRRALATCDGGFSMGLEGRAAMPGVADLKQVAVAWREALS